MSKMRENEAVVWTSRTVELNGIAEGIAEKRIGNAEELDALGLFR